MDRKRSPLILDPAAGLWFRWAMKVIRRDAFLALLPMLMIITGCAPLSLRDAERPPYGAEASSTLAGRESECLPEFADEMGWFGGDAAYSIPLPTGNTPTSLWLFGDSFVSRPNAEPGRQYPFVHNSIALSRCAEGGEWSVEYFWRRANGPEPKAFFLPDPRAPWVRQLVESTGGEAYYWLFDGFVTAEALFVGLLRVGESEPRGPFRLPFQLLGMDLARIENYRDHPDEWRIQISALSENRLAFPGSAFALARDHVYAFAFFDHGDGHSPRMLSRIPLDALGGWKADLSGDLETLVADSKWIRGFHPESARLLMQDDGSEMSVHFDLSSESWIAVYNPPIRRSDGESVEPSATRIYLRRAKHLEGPWTEPMAIAEIPETIADASQDWDENLFCYAAKAHPQFSNSDGLLVTYVCNLFSRSEDETPGVLRRLRDSPSLYRPRTLSVALP
jgi:hypothetical protein